MNRSIVSALIAALVIAAGPHAIAASPFAARPGAVPDLVAPIPNVELDAASLVGPSVESVASLNEGFDDISTLSANGWVLQNNSAPVGTTNWFQGTNVGAGGPFDAYDGNSNAYIGANFNNTTGGSGIISTWLLTPEIDFGGGASLTFYTRKPAPDSYPDRLEVRVSTNGASSNTGAAGTGIGDFTSLALSINPTLITGVYPTVWTQYTVTGLPHNGSGRIAFRYFVTGAGPLGSNSDYIGIDRVLYNTGAPEFHVGGTVTGLAGSGLVLRLNDGNDLTVAADGTFVFPAYITNNGNYAVTVAAQPSNLNQVCAVSNGSGTVAGADVANVTIACTTNTYSVGGSVSGLAGSGLVLHLNNGDDLAIAADGSFSFPNALSDGSSYGASLAAQPSNLSQTCTLDHASGTISGADVVDITVTCVTNTFHVGGTLSGLVGSGLVLRLDNGDAITAPANGNFVFPTALSDGQAYLVAVETQPAGPGQTCSIANAGGTLAGEDVTDVQVNCVTNTYHVGGSVSGLAGSGLTLHLGSGADLPVLADGAFVFPIAQDDGSDYVVTVSAQPTQPNQQCNVSNGSGSIAGHDITNVTIACTTNTYLIGGSVSGLKGTGLALHLDSGEMLPISSNGSFLFATPRTDGTSYSVTISAQPGQPQQTCTVANGNGTLSGHDVTNVAVSCTTATYSVGGSVMGIDGFDVVLQLNGGGDLTLTADGAFTFPTRLSDGSTYAVTVLSPVGACAVQNGNGVIAGSAVLTVQVSCDVLFADGFEPLQ